MYSTTFLVEGRAWFPLDMLRYDGCYPMTTDEAKKILVTVPVGASPERWTKMVHEANVELIRHRTTIQVALALTHRRKNPGLTDARWRSFDWRIVPGSIRTERI